MTNAVLYTVLSLSAFCFVFLAWCAGHGVGYDKGYRDAQEFAEWAESEYQVKEGQGL